MTARHNSDRCPACGSDEIQPYAVILGAAELYGYQCLACTVLWPVLQTGPAGRSLAPAAGKRKRAP